MSNLSVFRQCSSEALNMFRKVPFNGLEVEMEFLWLILASAPILEEISDWNYEHLLRFIDEMKQY